MYNKEYRQKYYQKNREKILAYAKAYRLRKKKEKETNEISED